MAGIADVQRDPLAGPHRLTGCLFLDADGDVIGQDHWVVVLDDQRELAEFADKPDPLVCVFCGFCIDACPVSAIVQTPEFELACYSRKDAFYTKDRLVAVEVLRRLGFHADDPL